MKIFISHASLDKDFVSKLVDHLQMALQLNEDDFFYTSGGSIESGDDWLVTIREALKDSNLVLAVVTPNFLESSYCLIELGASWIEELTIIPILISPTDSNSLTSTPFNSSRIQMLQLNSDQDLRTLQFDIRKKLKSKGFELKDLSKRELTKTPEFIDETLNPFIQVNRKRNLKDIQTLVKENKELVNALSESNQELDELHEENKSLRKLKDKEEIDQYDYTNSNAFEQFESYVSDIKDTFNSLHFITPSVMYERLIHGKSFSGGDYVSDLKDAVNKGQLELDEEYGEHSIDFEHTTVQESYALLDDLREFMNDNREDLIGPFHTKFGKNIMFNLKQQDFWKSVFNKHIYASDR